MKNKQCDCENWKEGMKKINAPIVMEQTRRGFTYSEDHFIQMNFCPWCGKYLNEEE